MTTLSYTVPVAGTTLNSVADPEVATALSSIITWSSEIDTSNLSSTAGVLRSQLAGGGGDLAWSAVSVDTTAADGFFYAVTAAKTITLPSPTVNQTIGIINAISGGGVVTVTASSGVIAGIGLSSATSIKLGTLWSSVTVIADSGNWYIISGQQDTGWVSLAGGSGISANSGAEVPAARQIGDRVFFRGSLAQASGNAVTGLTSVPSGIAKPAAAVDMPAPAYNGTNSAYMAGVLAVNPSTGAIGYTSNGGANSIYFFDGLSYSIS